MSYWDCVGPHRRPKLQLCVDHLTAGAWAACGVLHVVDVSSPY